MRRNKRCFVFILVLIFALSEISVIAPSAGAKASFGMAVQLDPIIGVNSATSISWIPIPSVSGAVATVTPQAFPVLTKPPYAGQNYVWPTATVTFTRPDNTTDVLRGPFKVRLSTVQGRTPDIVTIYTPNQMGNWKVNFYWPGDDNYNAVNNSYSFTVGPSFPKRETFAKLSFNPYPAVGLGQNLMINAWVTPPPLKTEDYYENYTFTLRSPSGQSTTIGPMDSEGPGTVWFDYNLMELGNWTITFSFPGDWIDSQSSITRSIIVQKDAVPMGYPDTPLPTEEWTFPINTNNREWRNVAGPWYQRNYDAAMTAHNPYTEAPKTAHVLWRIASTDVGGQTGGYVGSPHSIQTGTGYAGYNPGDVGIISASNPTISTVMAGRGYFTASGMIHCIDMRTGQTFWKIPGSFNVGAQRGRTTALYSFSSNRFIAYDAFTGSVLLNVTGMSMAFYQDPYVYTTVTGPERGVLGNLRLIKWDTSSNAADFASRIVYNVSMTYDLFAGWSIALSKDYFISMSFLYPSSLGTRLAIYNVTNGQQVYDVPISDLGNPDTWLVHLTPMGTGQGLVYLADSPVENQGLGYTAYDLSTGKLAWHMEKPDDPWGNFWAYTPQANAYGMIYGLSYSGVYAINATNGKIVWHYIAKDVYNEEPYDSNIDAKTGDSYGSYSFGSIGAIVGGGMVFAPSSEHSPTFIYRGQSMYAIDAFTGKEMWSIKGAYTASAIAYGILLASDTYNGVSYAFGKGPTETTVSIAAKTLESGKPVLIEGTVTDQSEGQKGTPAISDASMTAWMEYVHMQQPKPTNAAGVPVKVTAIDPNGNFQNIGTSTSDMFGNYAVSWTPPVPGLYKVSATFEGSESYYGSDAGTAFVVSENAAAPIVEPTPSVSPTLPPVQPTQTPAQPASPSPSQAAPPGVSEATPTYIAIAATVVVVVAVAAVLALRRRRK